MVHLEQEKLSFFYRFMSGGMIRGNSQRIHVSVEQWAESRTRLRGLEILLTFHDQLILKAFKAMKLILTSKLKLE